MSRFSDEAIRAAVAKAAYSDPAATDFLTRTIIARRDKVVAAWINQVCPVVDVALAADGTLTFRNAAVDAKAATPPDRYELTWFVFDNDQPAHGRRRSGSDVERISPRTIGAAR